MKRNRYIITGLFVVITATTTALAKEWRGIMPLHSTRADVERLLGKPNLKNANPSIKYGLYDLERERVDILYSSRPCTRGAQGAWRVPPDMVISIRVAPKKELLFSDLRLDVSKYRITDGGHVPGYTYYTDEQEGVQFEVIKGQVTTISYFPQSKDDRLRCTPSASTK